MQLYQFFCIELIPVWCTMKKMKTMKRIYFETVAYIYIKDRKLLLSKNKKHKAFYMPGGKREQGEDNIQALIRELKEELQINLIPESIKQYGIFEAQAYAKPIGTYVRIYCYIGNHIGKITPSAEVETIGFFSHDDYMQMEETAPAVCKIVKDLKVRKMIR